MKVRLVLQMGGIDSICNTLLITVCGHLKGFNMFVN